MRKMPKRLLAVYVLQSLFISRGKANKEKKFGTRRAWMQMESCEFGAQSNLIVSRRRKITYLVF